MKVVTVAHAKHVLARCNMTLRQRNGEYDVNFTFGTEASAYRTKRIDDAVNTAIRMAGERAARLLARTPVGVH